MSWLLSVSWWVCAREKTPRAFGTDEAATNGHLEVIRYLHMQCRLGCTTTHAANYPRKRPPIELHSGGEEVGGGDPNGHTLVALPPFTESQRAQPWLSFSPNLAALEPSYLPNAMYRTAQLWLKN
ncbi:Aste57867_19731 [Aphanomyces stellatus]|uniref:Aste57867_19731 protein n=1 Tax=Aphanomyces stellatus TaxID=120398 RepID=A0A485LDD5_9STRA|nr:hypothetical protein As57867_019666 [Aphanomyces stellatus]VFT96429.1 Aste57867_19731 [Aphanomyces stellatus]